MTMFVFYYYLRKASQKYLEDIFLHQDEQRHTSFLFLA